jgi:hypothetical protein
MGDERSIGRHYSVIPLHAKQQLTRIYLRASLTSFPVFFTL